VTNLVAKEVIQNISIQLTSKKIFCKMDFTSGMGGKSGIRIGAHLVEYQTMGHYKQEHKEEKQK